jgi:POT family proton-dependent oligopeptide transporter
MHIPAGITQAFNPFFIILLSPFLANLYMRFYNSGREISIPFKFALGTLVTGICFLFLAFGCLFPDANGQISLIWCFIAYGFYSLGELLVSAIGSAMVAKLLPARLGGFAQGMWFLSSAIGMRLGGQVSTYAAVKNNSVLTNFQILSEYQSLFIKLGVITVVVGVLLFIFVKYLDVSIKSVLLSKTST